MGAVVYGLLLSRTRFKIAKPYRGMPAKSVRLVRQGNTYAPHHNPSLQQDVGSPHGPRHEVAHELIQILKMCHRNTIYLFAVQ
jgi:hypothetical protein